MYWGKQRGTALTSFHKAHPHYRLHHGGGFLAGATLKGILNLLPTEPEEIEAEDVTFVVAMINGAHGDAVAKLSEPSGFGQEAINPCLHLRCI